MKLLFAYSAMIGLTVVANLLLKLGASSSANQLANLLNWRILAGLSCFALGAGFYVLILTRLPLNVAQSFAASQFIAVIIASALVLGEPIGSLRWVGIAMIAGGILLVGKSLS